MNLLSSATIFSFFTLISRVLGYLRDILIAFFWEHQFLQMLFLLLLDFRIPLDVFFQKGLLTQLLYQVTHLLKSKVKKKGKVFADDVLRFLLFILIFLVTIAEIFTPYLVYLIAPGFVVDEEKFQLAIELTRITFPFLLFVSLSSFFSGVLNSNNKFAAAAAAPIILNVVMIEVF